MPLPSSPRRTLVIDDDEMSRELLTVLLEAEGYVVDSAGSGEAALTHLGSHPGRVYDVILTDLQLPGIARGELARKLRRACGPRTLLLAISGSQPPAADIAAYDDFLLKPFALEAVAAALLRHGTRTDQAARAGGATPSSPAQPSPPRRRKRPSVSHQSGISPVTPPVLSLVACAAPAASNQAMSLPMQQQEFIGEELSGRDAPPEQPTGNRKSQAPVLNEQIYRQLAGSMSSTQLREMYSLCVNDARKRIAAMRALAADRDRAQFVREAHAIKGGSGMLGATELHRRAAAL
ncbi:MAG TPA: response regulator, partial [Acidobacteriaceae bacterium]|nr:response regulator [Acidobacteriaceae bacterium]